MDYSKLEGFISIPKKSEASHSKKIVFQDELVKILEVEGYSANAEKFFFEGFLLGGTNSFVKFLNLKPLTERQEIYNKLISGKLFVKNEKGISFKIMITLLGLMINNGNQDPLIIENIIGRLNGLSKNKENKRFSDVPKTIEKNFIYPLDPAASLPDFKIMKLTPSTLIKFKGLLEEALNESKLNHPNINRIRFWIDQIVLSEIQVKNVITQENKIIENERKEENNNKQEKLTKYEQLLSIANYVKELEQKNSDLRQKQDILLQEINQVVSEREKFKLEGAKANTLMREAINQKEEVQKDNYLLTKQVESKNIKIQELLDEIKKRDAVLSVFESDKVNSRQEQLNAIASKLKTEYQDFKDAIDMDMTLDLGENLRQQLSSVFKILTKNGIVLEKERNY